MRELGRTPSDDTLFVRLIEHRLVTIDASWDARDVCSTYWRYYVNFRPGAALLLSDGTYPLRSGRIHLVPAWVRFSCRNAVAIPHLYAHFDLMGLPGPLVREAFPRPLTLARDALQEAEARRLATALRGNGLPTAAAACWFKAVILRALASAIAALPRALAERCHTIGDRSEAVAPALAHIEASLQAPVGNADLARRCRMSEDYFIRRFRILIGQTPAQYILERRVAWAARELLLTDASIEHIAERCGFADRFSFTRAFTRRLGVPPATYRQAKQA